MTVDCAKLQHWMCKVTVDYAKLNTGCDCRL